MRTKPVLVVHRTAVSNVVPHIKVLSAVPSAVFKFTEDGVGTRRFFAHRWIMEEVDAGHDSRRHIDKPEGDHFAVDAILKLAGKGEMAVHKGLKVLFSSNLPERPLPSVVHIQVVSVVQIDVLIADSRLLNDQLNPR